MFTDSVVCLEFAPNKTGEEDVGTRHIGSVSWKDSVGTVVLRAGRWAGGPQPSNSESLVGLSC